MSSRIEDYALLGDLHTAALVGRDGSIDWLCLPHFDSPACFAALLGDEGERALAARAGRAAATCTRRRYRGDTLVLETTGRPPKAPSGSSTACRRGARPPDVVRIVEGISGRVPMHGVLRLRFDYGQVVPWVRPGRRADRRRRRAGLGLAVHAGAAGRAGLRHPLGVRRVRRASGCRSC